MTTKINLENVELVSSFVCVKVSELDIQNEEGTFVLVDNSQWNLGVARGSFQGCCELLRTIRERDDEFIILREDEEMNPLYRAMNVGFRPVRNAE